MLSAEVTHELHGEHEFRALHEAVHMLTLSLPVDSEQEASVMERNINQGTNLMLNAVLYTFSTWVRVPELLFVINVLIIYTNLKRRVWQLGM